MQAVRIDRRAWLIVAMLFLFMLINFADKAVLGLSATPIMAELKLTRTDFGTIASSFFLLFSAAAVATGFLVNRVSSKLVLIVMALVWSAAQIPMLFLTGMSALIANRVLLGVGEGPAYPVALNAAYKWFPNERRPLPSSLISTGGAVGAGITAPLVATIILTTSWHVAFATLGVVSLAWAIAYAIVGREGALDARAAAPGQLGTHNPPARVPYLRLLTCRSVIGCLVLGFAAYWTLTTAVVWLPNYLHAGAGYSQSAASWIVTLPSLTQIVAAPSISAFSERMKRRGRSSRVSRGLVTACCVFVSGVLSFMLPWTSGGITTILCVMFAFSVGSVVFSLGHVMVAEVTPPAQRGAMLGINNAIITLAGVFAPYVMGRVVDMAATPVEGFRMGFMIAGGIVVLGGLIGGLLVDPESDILRFARMGQGRARGPAQPALGI